MISGESDCMSNVMCVRCGYDFGSEEKSVTLNTWCVSTHWPAVRTMIWCSIQSFRGSLLTTTHRFCTLTHNSAV